MKSKTTKIIYSNKECQVNIKLEFDKPDNVIYFNNSSKTPLPISVQEAGRKAVLEESKPWTLAAECTDEIRTLFSHLVNASPDDIAIMPSTGFAMTLVAHNLFRTITSSSPDDNHAKKRILILQDEMSSEVYAWQEFQSQMEFVIVPHPQTEGGWTEAILDTITKSNDSNIDVCCVPQVHWSDGSYIDLKLVGHYCNVHNIKLIVDGTQSVGIMPIDVKEIQCDVLACSVHKWLLGPHGMSLVYIHPDYHDTWLPLDQHERSRLVFQSESYDAAENIIEKHGYPEKFVTGAKRCDGGGKKNHVLQPMIVEGLKIVNSLDLDDSQRFLRNITKKVLEGGRKIGLDIQPGPRCGHIIGLRPKSPELMALLTPAKMVEVANKLRKEKNIFFSVRCGAFRISPYLNTTSDDVQILLEALEKECKCNV